MEEMLSARKYALLTGRKVRTVQGWVDRGEIKEIQKVGTSWAASRRAWDEAALIDRNAGRPKYKTPAPSE